MTRHLFDNKHIRRIGPEFDGSPSQYDVLVTGFTSAVSAVVQGAILERLEFLQDVGVTGNVVYTATGSSATTLVAAALLDVAEDYIGQVAIPQGGNMVGQGRLIIDYDGTQTIEVSPAWAADPGSVDFIIVPSPLKIFYDLLMGADGLPVWPASAAPADGVNVAEAIRYMVEDQLEVLEDHIHMAQKTYPRQQDGVTVTGAAGAWDLGAAVTIVGTIQNIDNDGAADSGGGLTSIPLTGHGYRVGDNVALSGTVAYDGTYEIISLPDGDHFNITHGFVIEAFSGAEECIDVIPAEFDIHFVLIEDAGVADVFEVVLYKTDPAVASNEIGRVRVSKDAAVSGLSNAPMQTARQPADTRIFAKAASSSGGNDTIDISMMYHIY